MIAHLSGVVRRAGPDFVVLDVGGVGYLVSVSATTRQKIPAPGGEYELHIHTVVREDQLALYGFASVEELELFEMLIQVDGVGPKVGLNILSAASLEILKRAIVSEDPAPIRRANGVGARTAETLREIMFLAANGRKRDFRRIYELAEEEFVELLADPLPDRD